ncbi:MAG: hypothetical protein WAK71_16615 [Streptosporangiaceae bacterium]
MRTSTTPWMRLTRRLGRGRNPLRRRADVLDAWLTPAAVIVFLALFPLVVTVTGSLVRADNAVIERAQSSWHPVHATIQRTAPGTAQPGYGASEWQDPTRARWTADGRTHTGYVPAPAAARAGATVTVWVDGAGNVQLEPMTKAEAHERVIESTLSVLAILAALLIALTQLARWAMDRRRLASWESAWLSVGPVWSRQGK